MYSPKISEDLIPQLYQLARQVGKPMTKLVDDFLRPHVVSTYALLNQPTERNEPDGNKTQDRSIRS